MKSIRVKLYEFKELSDVAKKKVLEDHRDINVDGEFWSEFCIVDAKTIAALMGIEIEHIYFNGFWSQGDGACFSGSYKYKPNIIEAVKSYAPDECLHHIAASFETIQHKARQSMSFTVEHRGHYYHEHCTDFDVQADEDMDNQLLTEIEKDTKEAARYFMKWIYRRLEADYNYMVTDEAVIETLEANEYEFLENGKMRSGF